ncbi:MAG: hypothetical protein AAGA73_11365 [Pseudomonadota bacterium]
MLAHKSKSRRHSAAERIVILEQKGFSRAADISNLPDALLMRHPEHSVPDCHVVDDGKAIFQKRVANQAREWSFPSDDVEAFEAFVNRFQPTSLSASLKKASNNGFEVFIVFFLCLALPVFAIWLLFRIF